VQAEPSQVVGHLALGVLAGMQVQQRRDVLAQLLVGEAAGQEMEDEDGREQGSAADVVEPERGRASATA